MSVTRPGPRQGRGTTNDSSTHALLIPSSQRTYDALRLGSDELEPSNAERQTCPIPEHGWINNEQTRCLGRRHKHVALQGRVASNQRAAHVSNHKLKAPCKRNCFLDTMASARLYNILAAA